MIDTAPPSVEATAQDRLFGDDLAATATNRAAMAQIARDARTIHANGGRLTSQQFKVLREAAFYELAAACWPDRKALADEVRELTGMTYNALDKAKVPWSAHGPTEKVPVLRWLIERQAADLSRLKRRAPESRAEAKRDAEIEDAKARRLKAQADREENAAAHDKERFRAEAEDSAKELLTRACTALRHLLTDEAPSAISTLVLNKDRAGAEAAVRTYLETVIQAAAKAMT